MANNKSISELSVSDNISESDLLLISQLDGLEEGSGYYLSKQVKYSTIHNKISSDVAADYMQRIDNVARQSDNKYYSKETTFTKDEVNDKLSAYQKANEKLLNDTLVAYAKVDEVYKRSQLSTARQLANAFAELPVKYPLIDNDADSMSEVLGLQYFLSKTAIEENVTESIVNVPSSKVVYDLKALAEDNQRKISTKSTVQYLPNPNVQSGNKVGTIKIDNVNQDLYAGIQAVNSSMTQFDDGKIGCNESYMATQNWVKEYVGTDFSKTKMPVLDVPLLTPMFFDYTLQSSNFQWIKSDGSSYDGANTYSILYNHLLNDIQKAKVKNETINGQTITFYLAPDGHKICNPDQKKKLNSIFDSTGIAWYYVVDQAKNTFILPRTKHSFSGCRNVVGNYIAAGIPTHNHTGSFSGSGSAYGAYSHSGFSTFHMGFNGYCVTGIRYGSNSVSVSGSVSINNASDGVYGNSTTVQPPSTQMYLYFSTGIHKDYLERDEIDENEIWTFHYVDESGQAKQANKHVIVKAEVES